MKRLFPSLIFVFFLSLPIYAQSVRQTLEHNDIERNFRIFVPEHYDIESDGQLIMVLHGGGMDARLMRTVTNSRFESLIEENALNAVVVYPNGFGNAWNDGRIREGQSVQRSQIDDTDFLINLADELAQTHNIDASNLYIVGFSNGGGMAYRLACEASERITAIASVANLQASTLDCQPSSPVGILSINGDADPILPMTGGDLIYWDMFLGTVLSLEETIDLWSTNNECDGFAPPLELPDSPTDVDPPVYVNEAQNCDIPVTSIIIPNGGHTWAGTDYIVPEEEYGLTSQDIDTTDVIFDFFITLDLGK